MLVKTAKWADHEKNVFEDNNPLQYYGIASLPWKLPEETFRFKLAPS